MSLLRRVKPTPDPLTKYRKLSPDYWLEVAKRAYADGVIDQPVIDRILAQSHRGLIPTIEFSSSGEADWSIYDISRPLYDYYNEFIPWDLK